MSLSERIVKRLREDHGLADRVPDGSTIKRTHAGRHMRAWGAWSWYLVSPTGRPVGYGSTFPASALAKCPHKWEFEHKTWADVDLSIDPCTACQRSNP